MRLRVTHTTRYAYAQPARDSYNELRLMPLSDGDQTCLDFRLTPTPRVSVFAYDLPAGRVHHFTVRPPHQELIIQADSLVVTHRANPFQRLQLVTPDMDFYADPLVRQKYYEFLMPTERVPFVAETERIALVAQKQSSGSAASFLIALTRLLHRVFTYSPGATNVNTSILQVLEQKQGVCQDFAHLMLAVCRQQGIPARYISGYLYTGAEKEDETEINLADDEHDSAEKRWRDGRDGPRQGGAARALVSGDAMHAWVECLLPGGQWCGFDPTNNLVVNAHFIKAHYGRDYSDVTPVRGLYRGPAAESLDVGVRVTLDQP